MPTTISLPPPAKALHQDATWLKLQSSLVALQNSYFRLASTGPNAPGETLSLTFGGTTVTFTIAAVPDGSGTQLPRRTAQDDGTYAAELAEAIARNQLVTDTFRVYPIFQNNAWLVWIIAKERTALAVDYTNGIGHLAVTDYSSTGPYLEDNLRALVEVYRDTDSPATDISLGQQHAPYGPARTALFDLSPHFAGLDPQPPWTGTLTGFHVRHEASAYLDWYFRCADQYGIPAIAEAMHKQAGGTVFFGSHSASALADYATAPLKHVTVRRDGLPFWKPVGLHQPDWCYYWNSQARTDYNTTLKLYFTDGTTQSYGGAAAFTLEAGRLYSLTTGPAQLDIEAKALDAEKTAYRYEVSLIDGADTYYFTRRYAVICEYHRWGHLLLYANGVGGMETVWLDGKRTEMFNTSKSYARTVRTDSWQPQQGDLRAYGQQGSPSWTASTGWYEDPAHLVHLRQLPLATHCWIVDTRNARYLPVHVSPGEIQVSEDDRDLHALELKITAAWTDMNSNL